jgi:hypothetical protein
MKLYFTPDYYYLTDNKDNYVQLLQTSQMNGSYKLQFINIDSLKDATIDDLETYPWPDPFDPGRTTGLEEEARQVHLGFWHQ